MKIKVQNTPVNKIKCDLLVIGFFAGGKRPPLLKNNQLTGKLCETRLICPQGKTLAKQVLAIGLGIEHEFDADRARKAAGAAITEAKKLKAKVVAISFPVASLAQVLAQAGLIANYQYQGFASAKDEEAFAVQELIILGASLKGITTSQIIAEGVNRARDLVNGPSNKITPSYLAAEAKKVAGVKTTVLSLAQAKKLGLAAYYAVAKGSAEPAKFIVMRYGSGQPEIALVGKGITFDSGGISIKPSRKMWEMKTDMAGAAAVLETMRAIARLKIRKNVVGILPCCENMPSGGAQKPGDVIGSLTGKTIEIISTDAEGRMIVADAIGYAKKVLKVKKIIDVATLTGACVIALGDAASGIMGNHQALVDQLVEAGKRAGEKLWQLPLFDEYKEYSKSQIADIKNCTELGKASTSVGGIFLELFAGDVLWAHIDIAGTAYLDKEGATGVMVRTLTEYLRS